MGSPIHTFRKNFLFVCLYFSIKSLSHQKDDGITRVYEFPRWSTDTILKNDEIRNWKEAYNGNTREDKSGFVNLKILYLHFPPEVNITGIMVLHRVVAEDYVPRYTALVYTTG